MTSKLILSKDLRDKLSRLDFTNPNWQTLGINDFDELEKRILLKLNKLNVKIKTTQIEEGETKERSENYGYVINSQNDKKIAYVFVIPPFNDSRSGFLAQHIYPGHTGIMNNILNSSCFEPFNHPIFIININGYNLTDSKIVNIRGAMTLGFFYTDVFEREIPRKYIKLIDLDKDLKEVNAQKENQYFDLDIINKKLTLKTDTLKTGTNDRYFYSSKVYPALYLASNEFYSVDTSVLTSNQNVTNGTLNALLAYANKLKLI